MLFIHLISEKFTHVPSLNTNMIYTIQVLGVVALFGDEIDTDVISLVLS